MRRTALAVTSILLVATGLPAAADPGHERPRITVMRWQDPPVTANEPGCEEQGTCSEEILIVKAHDPDSSITEIQVRLDEEGGGGQMIFAHTYCVQGYEAGQPARLKIPVSFDEPGTYTVAAVALSHRRCLPHEKGDRHPEQHSRVYSMETVVQPAG